MNAHNLYASIILIILGLMKRLFALRIALSLVLLIACRQPVDQLVQATGAIRAGNFSVYYQRTGSGPALVLLHAGLQDHRMWDEQVKALSAYYEVITPDLPYHGLTTGVDTSLPVADVIRLLLDSLRIEQAAVAGLSIGASVVQDFVIAYPDRVRKGVLVSPGIVGYGKIAPIDSASMAWYYLFTNALAKKDTVSAARAFTKAWAEGLHASPGDSLLKRVYEKVYTTTLTTLRKHKMQHWPRFRGNPPAVEQLSAIKKPVLIIDGDKDLPYIGACAGYLTRLIPGAQRTTIPDAAHLLTLEKPAVFNELLLAFLQADQQP